MTHSVCVFCSSSGSIDGRYLELAREFGRHFGPRGWTLVSGGGSVSMMGELARSVRASGGHTIGVIPQALKDLEVADLEADELVVTHDMRQRKGVMDERSDAFVALPGGIGTLEELMEAWTSRSLAMHDKPVWCWIRGMTTDCFADKWKRGWIVDSYRSPASSACIGCRTPHRC